MLEKGQIILRPISEQRKDWDKAFQKMHENGVTKYL
jgi:antitoxin MazE